MRIALAKRILTLPADLRRSLTWDQGKEMAEHVRFSVETGVQVYFCDPKAPGSAAPTRTPADCFANTSRRTPTCPCTHSSSSTPSPGRSTDALDRRWAGCHHLRRSPRRCVETLEDTGIGDTGVPASRLWLRRGFLWPRWPDHPNPQSATVNPVFKAQAPLFDEPPTRDGKRDSSEYRKEQVRGIAPVLDTPEIANNTCTG